MMKINNCCFAQGESKNATPWVLVIAESPALVANLVVRGPLPLNCLQLLPRANADIAEFGELMTSALAKADGLMTINYPGHVVDVLNGNCLKGGRDNGNPGFRNI